MFEPLFFIHVSTFFVVCTCFETEEEVKVDFKEHFHLNMKRLRANVKSDGHELMNLGTELFEQKKFTEAILAFNDAIARNQKKPWYLERSYQGRGKCFAKMGKMEFAVSDFEKALDCQAYVTESRMLLVNALIDTGNYDRIMEHVLQLPHSDMAGVANKLCFTNQFDKAMDVYNKLINKYPGMEYYIARGNCHTKLGDTDLALSDFQSATVQDNYLTRDEKLGYSRVLLCLALFTLGKNTREELSDLDDVQFRVLASKLLEQERVKDAITCLSAAIEKYPQNEWYYTERASLHFKEKDYQSAVGDYKKCVELHQSNTDCELRLIEAAVEGGNYIEAKQYLEAFESRVDNTVLLSLHSKLHPIREKLDRGLEATK